MSLSDPLRKRTADHQTKTKLLLDCALLGVWVFQIDCFRHAEANVIITAV